MTPFCTRPQATGLTFQYRERTGQLLQLIMNAKTEERVPPALGGLLNMILPSLILWKSDLVQLSPYTSVTWKPEDSSAH